MVNGDRGMLEQVRINIGLKARPSMPEGGHLVIQSGPFLAGLKYCRKNNWSFSGACIRISCNDTGHGNDKDDFQQIFELPLITKKTRKGAGSGLSVVDSIAEQHGGHVMVLNEKGLGTTFPYLFQILGGAVKGAGAFAESIYNMVRKIDFWLFLQHPQNSGEIRRKEGGFPLLAGVRRWARSGGN